MSDEQPAILENTQNSFTCVSRVLFFVKDVKDGRTEGTEYLVAFF